ncbi:hypothetical protein C8N24_0659 [Solirubrobacter pauli]|uniref:Uncharacterized protein n=1 Tax=Solirubrobacter pauli TaxID=166793 RepID=A0A660LCS1_9ACTN|nr:hypothetical protein [Solirubrobacter pauli]RKQ90844.1 hypothetical protein C8N24_0659 [Solirubrobacter pauli]
MSPARARLRALAAAAGYDRETLELIVDAALPAHLPGKRLNDTLIGHVATAVEVLAQCGYTADELELITESYRLRYRDGRWRDRFWHNQLCAATLRFNQPRFYGLSPCESDRARLAEFARAA